MVGIGNDPFITFRKDTHQYFDTLGVEYQSVSRVLKKIVEPFDRERISLAVAKAEAGVGASYDQIKKLQEEKKNEWKGMADDASNMGTEIHSSLERYSITGRTEEKYMQLAKDIHSIWYGCKRQYQEVIFYSRKYKIAGTSDKCIERNGSKVPVIDIFDYKTNVRRGIEFDSSRVDKNWIKKYYNKFFLPPFDYLEYCNYTNYALQLSSYAYMAEEEYKVKIGRLGIIWIKPDLTAILIPVPYMRDTVINIFEHVNSLKEL